jgi:hypothetical protein
MLFWNILHHAPKTFRILQTWGFSYPAILKNFASRHLETFRILPSWNISHPTICKHLENILHYAILKPPASCHPQTLRVPQRGLQTTVLKRLYNHVNLVISPQEKQRLWTTETNSCSSYSFPMCLMSYTYAPAGYIEPLLLLKFVRFQIRQQLKNNVLPNSPIYRRHSTMFNLSTLKSRLLVTYLITLSLSIYFLFFSWGEAESTWYCGHCLAYCTSPRW